ncbi:nucleotide exchange factor GrpE [Candidatus Peregrinibacteria bacterium]|nr:nucleotide exchange factor GrpE [Candidatus Peregrinibacteria bacterium]
MPEEAKEWATGVTAIFKQLEETLQKNGLEKIELKEGASFDPETQEAVSMQPGKKDKIVQVLEAGYKIEDRILRRSKVIVGNGEKEQK